jgi:hypothetical protein
VIPNDGWSRRLVARLFVIVLFFFPFTSHAFAEWKEKVLYSFQGLPDGGYPVGSVVFDKAGNLYGATQEGGSSSCASIYQCGTVYQLAPPAKKGDSWTETVLYIFQGNAYHDGASPQGGLVIDSEGNLYGTTAYGGTGNCVLLGILMGCGTVYELSPPQQKGAAWTETVLYSFPTSKQGYVPAGDLVFDSAGSLYGATIFGGGYGTTCDGFYQYCGAVFRLSRPKKKGGKWTEQILHSFAGGTDGANPNGGLTFDSTSNVYGTTYAGGNQECHTSSSVGCGMVFALRPPTTKGDGWTEKVLHRFDGKDGANSEAGVVFDGNGNLYGTTYFAPGPYGLVFELKKPSGTVRSWAETVLHAFSDGNDGANPAAGLVFDDNRDLYGTTSIATSQSARGNVFRIGPPSQKGGSWAFGVIYTFSGIPDGEFPASALVLDKSNNVYGTTQGGGSGTGCGFYGCGTVFEVSP